MILIHDLFGIFEDLLRQDSLVGVWLSCTSWPWQNSIFTDIGIDCKSNIAIIGSFMVTALLASTDDNVYQLRQGALEEFRRLLQRSEGRFDFAALPLLRLNLLVERFSESRASPE